MSNLDNLISKILYNYEEKSKQIIESANVKAAEIMQDNIASAEKEKEQILCSAKDEAKTAAEQIVLSKRLEIRDDNLKAKQSVIDKVFDLALNKLNEMPQDKFMEFLLRSVSTMELDGEELILPSRYNIDINELNKQLIKNNKKGNLKLFKGNRKIDGGFILLKDGIENNNTFETLISYYRYELESDIIPKLF